MYRASFLKNLFSRNKRMIAGNWKSNKTYSEALDFVKNTINNLKFNTNNVGTHHAIQMLSSPPSHSTLPAFSHSIPETNFHTELQLKTLPTMDLEHTLDKSAQNISKTSVFSGLSSVTPKEEPYSDKKTISLFRKQN